MLAKEFKVTQKTLISFCIQVPLSQNEDKSKQENIFKSSRLMLHEIVGPAGQDWLNAEHLENDKKSDAGSQLIKENQRLEVIKITRCKMRAKDILEIEIGLKNINKLNTPLETRKFILRFLNKLDPQLACKGRLMFTGFDLVKLQKMQHAVIQNTTNALSSSGGASQ